MRVFVRDVERRRERDDEATKRKRRARGAQEPLSMLPPWSQRARRSCRESARARNREGGERERARERCLHCGREVGVVAERRNMPAIDEQRAQVQPLGRLQFFVFFFFGNVLYACVASR